LGQGGKLERYPVVVLSVIILLYSSSVLSYQYALATRLWKGEGVHQPQNGTINEEASFTS